jgi:hypothetical protein
MFCVASGLTTNFATVPKFEESVRKSYKGVGKTGVAREFRPQRGLTKGYHNGELGTLEYDRE